MFGPRGGGGGGSPQTLNKVPAYKGKPVKPESHTWTLRAFVGSGLGPLAPLICLHHEGTNKKDQLRHRLRFRSRLARYPTENSVFIVFTKDSLHHRPPCSTVKPGKASRCLDQARYPHRQAYNSYSCPILLLSFFGGVLRWGSRGGRGQDLCQHPFGRQLVNRNPTL